MGEVSSQSDDIGFLQTAEASLRIKEHMDLFLWLQGDVQRFVPHEVLIAAWGDFSTNAISFDVISPLPRLRTENLYVLGSSNRFASTVCRRGGVNDAGTPCGVVPFLVRMRDRWHGVGCSPLAVLRREEAQALDFICSGCDPDASGLLKMMRSSLVHGFSDQRGKHECVYVFLSTKDLSDSVFRRNLRFLLPYIDSSLRQVAHLPIQHGDSEPVIATPVEPEGPSGLSQREIEIMDWVRIGKTNYEVGMILNISAFTVKNHLQRIFKKLDVTNRAQAVERLGRGKRNV